MRPHESAMIGARSVVFCKTLVADILATPALGGSEFAYGHDCQIPLKYGVGGLFTACNGPARL